MHTARSDEQSNKLDLAKWGKDGMGQLTPLWLLGLALAWRLRNRPGPAGAAIALASLTKLLPALCLLPFLLVGAQTGRRRACRRAHSHR